MAALAALLCILSASPASAQSTRLSRSGEIQAYQSGEVLNALAATDVGALATRSASPGARIVVGGRQGGAFLVSASCAPNGITRFAMAAGRCAEREWDGVTARPEWAGAVAGDAIDDTQALAAALAVAPRVELSRGTYLTSTVQMPAGAELVGVGSASVLKLRSGLPRTFPQSYGGITSWTLVVPAGPGGAFSLRNLTLDHNWQAYGEDHQTPTVSVLNTDGALIEGCTFVNANTMAVWADSRNGDETRNVRFIGNHIASSRGGGFSTFGRILNAIVADNLFENGEDDAVAFQDAPNTTIAGYSYSQNVTVTGNVIRAFSRRNTSNSTPHAILIHGVRYATVANNVADGTVSSAIIVMKGQGVRSAWVTLTGNVSTGSGTVQAGASISGVPVAGYIVQESDHVTMIGNVTDGSGGAGVDVRSSSYVSIQGGEHASLGGAGVRISDSNDVSVEHVGILNPGLTSTERAGVLVIANGAAVQRVVVSDTRIRSTDGRMEYGVQTSVNTGLSVDVRVSGGSILGAAVSATTLPRERVRGTQTIAGTVPVASGAVLIPAGAGSVSIMHRMGARPFVTIVTSVGEVRGFVSTVDDAQITISRDAVAGTTPYPTPMEVSWYAEL